MRIVPANFLHLVAVLIGASVIPLGLIIRRNLPETLHAADDAALAPDATKGDFTLKEHLRPYAALILLGLMMLTSATIGTYIRNYMTTYALTTLHLQATVAFGVTAVAGILAALCAPWGGQMSDRFGRKPVMLISTTLVLLSNFPAFWLIQHFRTAFVFYAAVGWLAALMAIGTGVIIVALTESLPKNIRSGAVATIYAFAISIFGGSTQFILGWLLDVTKNPLVPAYYGTVAAAVGLVAVVLINESSPIKLARQTQGKI